MQKDDVLVSVKVLTYNQENYIGQCLESIASQKTDFRFEIVVADDCSTDGTKEVIRDCEGRYPDIVIPIFNAYNLGVGRNSENAEKYLRGKYVAYCDGDDCWCDSERLRRDVAFLENHSEYIAICGKSRIIDEFGNDVIDIGIRDRVKFWNFDKNEYTIKDFQKWKMPGHISALTARRITDHLEYDGVYSYFSDMVGDRTQLLLLSLNGKIRCSGDVVSCYRFRERNADSNFMSQYRYGNIKDQDFLMMKKMEKWTRESCGFQLDLSEIEKDRLAGAVVLWMENPSKRNYKVLRRIIRYSERPLQYRYYVLKTVLLKEYYRKIRKEDRPINL